MKSWIFIFLIGFFLREINGTSLRSRIKDKSNINLKLYRGDPEVEGFLFFTILTPPLFILGCVACKMIWENIEEALGEDSRNSILAAEAFQYFCKISPDIFFNPVY